MWVGEVCKLPYTCGVWLKWQGRVDFSLYASNCSKRIAHPPNVNVRPPRRASGAREEGVLGVDNFVIRILMILLAKLSYWRKKLSSRCIYIYIYMYGQIGECDHFIFMLSTNLLLCNFPHFVMNPTHAM